MRLFGVKQAVDPRLRREALRYQSHPFQQPEFFSSLYREILKVTKAFYWTNEKGIPWCVVLRESARKEFETHRHLSDRAEISRQIMMGHRCVEETKRRFNVMEDKIRERVTKTRFR